MSNKKIYLFLSLRYLLFLPFICFKLIKIKKTYYLKIKYKIIIFITFMKNK